MSEPKRETPKNSTSKPKDTSIIPEVAGGFLAGAITSMMGYLTSRGYHLTKNGLPANATYISIMKDNTFNHDINNSLRRVEQGKIPQIQEWHANFSKATKEWSADMPMILTASAIATVAVGATIHWMRHHGAESHVDAAQHQGMVENQQDKKIEPQRMS